MFIYNQKTSDFLKDCRQPDDTSRQLEVPVPAGKLGISVTASERGAIVKSLKPGSPMKGLLRMGDIIVRIDDINAANLSYQGITDALKRKENKKRTFIVRRATSDENVDATQVLADTRDSSDENSGETPENNTNSRRIDGDFDELSQCSC